MVNEDKAREAAEGVRRDAKGNRLPTPYRCCQCAEDAYYPKLERWYCAQHWCEASPGAI